MEAGTPWAPLRTLAEEARATLSEKSGAREEALRRAREVVQNSALSIRAAHRGEREEAERLLAQARQALEEVERLLSPHRDIYYAGFVEDAQKELAEAAVTFSVVFGTPLPTPSQLGMGVAPFLNGLGEAMGEVRRYILDSLRRGDFSRCEELLDLMDEVYTLLMTMDFPEAVTGGLRRTTDALRGILERTRGDITTALRQHHLEGLLRRLEEGRGDG